MKILDKIKEILEKIFYRKKLFLSRNEFSLLAYEYRGLEMYIRNSAYQHIIEISNGEMQKNVLAQVPMTKFIMVENWKQTAKGGSSGFCGFFPQILNYINKIKA